MEDYLITYHMTFEGAESKGGTINLSPGQSNSQAELMKIIKQQEPKLNEARTLTIESGGAGAMGTDLHNILMDQEQIKSYL